MEPRLLFVVSGSYGDLSLAITFLYGQELASQAAVALPETLYRVNHGRLPLQLYRYRSVQDIVGAAAAWESRVVIFLSAYGFPIEQLTSPQGVRQLVQQLRAQNCAVATTDPFLGSASIVQTSDIREMSLPSGWLRRLIFGHIARRIARDLKRSSDVLRDVIHLYPVPVDGVIDRDQLRTASFFNAEVTRRHPEWEDFPLKRDTIDSPERTWLFVLAQTDVVVQQHKWGRQQFVKQLVRLFEQTCAAGRRPALVGPAALRKALGRALPVACKGGMVQFCSYPEFAARLLAAEYAFYWNAFSCSAVLMRLAKKLPVFFFDQGHVAELSKRIYRDGVRMYYGGWEPDTLPLGTLDAAVLARLATVQLSKVDALVDHWSRSPAPRQLIDVLLNTPTA